MARRESRFRLITKNCSLKGKGLEIGPSYNGVCRKADGYDVEILDCDTKQGLLEKYGADPNVSAAQLAAIEDVDYVWTGGSYLGVTGKASYYDYIIASHVIEHTTDVIGFLNDCGAMLKPGGVLSLVVPDKRYTFDRFRALTSVGAMIDDHANPAAVHSLGHMADQWLGAVKAGDAIAFSRLSVGRRTAFRFLYGDSFFSTFQKREWDADYHDCHHSVFTPSSLRLILLDLRALGYIDMAEASFLATPPQTSEFYIALKKQPPGEAAGTTQQRRLELLLQIEAEQAEAARLLGVTGERRGAGRVYEWAHRTARRLLRK